tara:strand:+ start:7197 stop:8339 length:1143 start_codon:yes stop_codon:yes gene_type:complete
MPGYGDNTELKDEGGVATGGQGGIDDIPAMLTEGEVVLNEEQQMAVGGIAGKEPDEVFAEAGVPGFEDKLMMQEGGEVMPKIEVMYSDEAMDKAQDMVDAGEAKYIEEKQMGGVAGQNNQNVNPAINNPMPGADAAVNQDISQMANQVADQAASGVMGNPMMPEGMMHGGVAGNHWINAYADGGEVGFFERMYRKFKEFDKKGKKRAADIQAKADSKKDTINKTDVVEKPKKALGTIVKERKEKGKPVSPNKPKEDQKTYEEMKPEMYEGKETEGGFYPEYKEGSQSEMSKNEAYADARHGRGKYDGERQKDFTWQGRKYNTMTAEEKNAGKTKWDDSAKKWVKPEGEAKEMRHGGAVHAYQTGGQVGGMFDFPTKNSRD